MSDSLVNQLKGTAGFIVTDVPDFVLVGVNEEEFLVWFILDTITNQTKS